MSDQIDELTAVENTRVVEVFLNALQEKDLATADVALDDDVVYQNVGYTIMRGRDRVMKVMRGLDRPSIGFEVKIHRIAAEDVNVLTERTDALVFGPLRLQFWVCGVFEVRDGKITLWRDYFDALDMVKATVRGVFAIGIPALRPSM